MEEGREKRKEGPWTGQRHRQRSFMRSVPLEPKRGSAVSQSLHSSVSQLILPRAKARVGVETALDLLSRRTVDFVSTRPKSPNPPPLVTRPGPDQRHKTHRPYHPFHHRRPPRPGRTGRAVGSDVTSVSLGTFWAPCSRVFLAIPTRWDGARTHHVSLFCPDIDHRNTATQKRHLEH